MRFEPLLEKNMLPDFIIRWGARRLTGRRLKQITSQSVEGHRANFMEENKTEGQEHCLIDNKSWRLNP